MTCQTRPTGLPELLVEVADLDAATRFSGEAIGLETVQRRDGERKAVWLGMDDSTALGLWPVETGGDKASWSGSPGCSEIPRSGPACRAQQADIACVSAPSRSSLGR